MRLFSNLDTKDSHTQIPIAQTQMARSKSPSLGLKSVGLIVDLTGI